MDNLDIFVFAHKQFNHPLTSDFYKIVSANDDFTYDDKLQVINMDSSNIEHFSNLRHSYSEMAQMLWIYKNVELKDYVGFCQYRAFFPFLNDYPTNLLDKHDMYCLFSKPNSSIMYHYGKHHDIKDFMLLTNIVHDLYPDMYQDYIQYMTKYGSPFYYRNMYITTKEIFLQMMSVMENVMAEFDKRIGVNSDEDVKQYIIKKHHVFDNRPGIWPDVSYQSRLQGFISERLTSFLIHHFVKPSKLLTTKHII